MDIWEDEDEPTALRNASEREWSKLSDAFINDGYREGITAGKESALQEGFDEGFAAIGVPLGRRIGNLRGMVAGLRTITQVQQGNYTRDILIEINVVVEELGAMGLSDLAPPDEQAITHAKEHAAMNSTSAPPEDGMGTSDPLDDINAAFQSLGTQDSEAQKERRRLEAGEQVQQLETRLRQMAERMGIRVQVG